MHVDRLPRRLRYWWIEGGTEIEYPTDIPTPAPEIKCDEVMVTVPPALPAQFQARGQRPNGGEASAGLLTSWSVPWIENIPFSGNCLFRINGTNQFGQPIRSSISSLSFICGSGYVTPGNTQQPRRDLLVGSDRIVNPTLNTPCPKWRFTGGNCPPGSIDCGNCCLDCASVKAGIEGVTSAVLPFSIWRPRL